MGTRLGWLALAVVAALTPAACASRTPLPVDGARLHARVVKQVAFGPRVPGTAGHEAMRAWLVSELERLGARVEQQHAVDSTLGRPLELVNVIARFGPAEGRRVLLCAHWDSRPVADRDPDPAKRGQPIPGANDGGSGVAVLLEVAELLSRRPAPVAVELAFFDAEDLGGAARPEEFSLGARAYARALAARPRAEWPVAGFLFDMVGDRDLAIHPEVVSAQRAASLVALVLEGARVTGARHFHPDPRYSLTDDHIPLIEAGLPTVDIIDFDYPAWHTVADGPDQVSPESLAEVARVAAWLVYDSPLARAR
jgi:glutaminyl-peptide cyclotransferase